MRTTLHLIFIFLCLLFAFGLNAQTNSVTYSVPGTSTFTVPNGVTQITVEVWGAGGAGGTIDGNGPPRQRGAGGGGGGAYARKDITVTPCDNITYTVGAGATTASKGGDTYFLNTSTVLAKGGFTAIGDTSSSGALGGSASSSIGTIKYSGGNGADGTTSTTYGGGGGSSAGTISNGNSGSTSFGGIAPSGGGAGGNGKTGTDGSGSIGASPGAGGGGALKSVNGIEIGGKGGDGKITISWVVGSSNSPTATNGTNASCNSFSANWSALPNTTTYFLDVSTVNTFTTFVSGYNNRNVGNVLTYSVTGLNPITTYYYRVRALTACGSTGNSNTITYSTILATPAVPGIISGSNTQCPSLKNQTYSISEVPNATTYSWSVPTGWTITSGAGTTNISVTTGTSGGDIIITAGNSCGSTASSSLAVSVNPSSIDFDGLDDYIDFGNVHNQTSVFSLEAWVLQEESTTAASIISKGDIKSGAGNQRGYHLALNNDKPNLTWYNNSGTSILNIEAPSAISNNKWHHIAAVYNGTEAILYIDGIEVTSGIPSSSPLTNTGSFLIGAMYDSSAPTEPKNYFNGFIDEVRVWNIALTEQQIHEMMNQEIEANGTAVRGKIIPKDFSGGVLWTNLKGYYPMNDGTATDQSSNAFIGIPKNICLSQSQTAPMPYTTINDGSWTTPSTWLYGDVWDIENFTSKTWGIVQIKNNVTTSNSHSNYGLIIDNGKTLTVNGSNEISNSWYLNLNGTIDLKDNSQLIQESYSDLVTSSTGKIIRRQEGAASKYWYNYWSSPVGALKATSLGNDNASTNNPNNSNFKLGMLKDGDGNTMQFTSANDAPGKISSRWIYRYQNGITYTDWISLNTTSDILPGVGYIHKGTGTSDAKQQYIFEGRPHNGTIKIDVTDIGGPGSIAGVSKTHYLMGNPYASSLDLHQFIDDNSEIISGTLMLWDQWDGTSHNLTDYDGGYAQVNKLGAVKAFQFDGLLGAVESAVEDESKLATKYLSVGQGFIAEIIKDGTIEFNNGQRIFASELESATDYNEGTSFFRVRNTHTARIASSNKIKKIRLEFNSVDGPSTRRELLLGFSNMTSDGYDYGYDSKILWEEKDDLNLLFNNEKMLMQAYSRIKADKVIPLSFKASGDYKYTIKATDFVSIEDDQEVYLRDNLTQTYFNLRSKNEYTFNSVAGEFNKRFTLVFQQEQSKDVLGTSEYGLTKEFIFYNNESGKLFVKGLEADAKNISISNILGQVSNRFTNLSPEELRGGLKLSNLGTGIYIVSVKTYQNKTIDKKIMINN